jgi:hypothetical protein
VTETETRTVPVSHEEVRVEREPITDGNIGSALDGPAISEEEHEVVLTAEQPVVQKEAVPVERVRLDTETVTEQVPGHRGRPQGADRARGRRRRLPVRGWWRAAPGDRDQDRARHRAAQVVHEHPPPPPPTGLGRRRSSAVRHPSAGTAPEGTPSTKEREWNSSRLGGRPPPSDDPPSRQWSCTVPTSRWRGPTRSSRSRRRAAASAAVDPAAVLGGGLAGLGTAALLGGVASAIGLEIGQGDAETLALVGLATALVIVALSALFAGWVAGRAARFDGARNGVLAGVLLSLLLALMGAAGAYSAADGGLPVSLDSERLTTAALIGAVAALVVSALAGLLGGRVGARWHRDVDDVIVGTRPGAVATAREQVVR